jgi:hypothetical protein
MGVLPCGRDGCENIMCRRSVLGTGYICDECYEELLEYRRTWPDIMTRENIRGRVEHFMESSPGTYAVLRAEEIDREFNGLVRETT